MGSGRDIWVDEQGYAHDDENNVWFVGMPSGHYNFRDLPKPKAERAPKIQKQPVERTQAERDDLTRLVLAAAASGDYKGAEFLNEVRGRSSLSEKQISYVESLRRRYGNFARRFPAIEFYTWNNVLRLEVRKPLTPDETRRLEDFFHIRTNEQGKEELLAYKLHPNLKPEPSSVQKGQIAALDRLLARKNIGFLKTIRYQLEDGSSLSPRQMEVVRKIFAENGEPEPPEFKTAAETELRKATIRLAHSKPELRDALLPILTKTAEENWPPEHVSGYGTDSELYRLISVYAETMMMSFPGLATATPQDAYLDLKLRAGDEANDYNSFLDWIEKHIRFPTQSRG